MRPASPPEAIFGGRNAVSLLDNATPPWEVPLLAVLSGDLDTAKQTLEFLPAATCAVRLPIGQPHEVCSRVNGRFRQGQEASNLVHTAGVSLTAPEIKHRIHWLTERLGPMRRQSGLL